MTEAETTPFAPTTNAPAGNPASPDLLVIEPRPLPRLGISHFLLWMLCTSLYLAAMRQSLAGLSAQLEMQGAEVTAAMRAGLIFGYVVFILYGCAIGAVWAGTAILAATRIRGGAPLLRQPGHWLLLVIGIQSGAVLLSINFLWDKNVSESVILFMDGTGILLGLAIAALYVIAAWRSRFRRWTVFFVAMFVSQMFFAAMSCVGFAVRWFQGSPWWLTLWFGWVQSSGAVLIVIAVVMLAIAIVLDIRNRQKRDWLHWLGVAMFGTITISTVCLSVWVMLML